MRLLLIEDDPLLGSGLRDFLAGEGHRVDWARTLADAGCFDNEAFDAWLVDWRLPDGSGLAWLAGRRRRGERVPALMLTARDGLADRVQGLDAGADDYLVKPFAPEELAARLRAVSRRSSGAAGQVLQIDGVEIDLDRRQVRREGATIDLTAREWSVLEALARRSGRHVSRNELEQIVLGGAMELASNAIEVHVAALRRKLGHDLLLTQRGWGYRLRTE